jgi:hypothetical protein
MTDNLPRIDERTVTVSPRAQEATISPSVHTFPASLSVSPGSAQDCEVMFRHGILDAEIFLQKLKSCR